MFSSEASLDPLNDYKPSSVCQSQVQEETKVPGYSNRKLGCCAVSLVKL